jgi:hypothetical protein
VVAEQATHTTDRQAAAVVVVVAIMELMAQQAPEPQDKVMQAEQL